MKEDEGEDGDQEGEKEFNITDEIKKKEELNSIRLKVKKIEERKRME